MRRRRISTCLTCAKPFDSMGIASHRAAHTRRGETCTIEYSTGEIFTFAPRDTGVYYKVVNETTERKPDE